MANKLITEEQLEIIARAHLPRTTPSPSVNLGSHLPNPLNVVMNLDARVAPPRKNSVEGTNIIVPTATVDTPIQAHASPSMDKRDQINNVAQKEIAMALSGVTRRKTYEVIARLLSATKWSEVTDAQGNTRWDNVPDLEKQRQGAEMALRVMGDMIEHKTVEYGIADSTLEKLKALSVAELRGRAAEMLEGRRKAIDLAAGGGGSRIAGVIDGEIVK